MTTILIEGVEYDLTSAIREPAIRDLVDLKRQTQSGSDKHGMSVRIITRTLNELGVVFQSFTDDVSDADVDAVLLEFFDSVEHLQAFAGMVFLCRRKVGQKVSFDEASAVSLAHVGFQFEAEEAEEEDPKDLSTPEVVDAPAE